MSMRSCARLLLNCIVFALAGNGSSSAQHFVFSTYGQGSGLTNLNVSSFVQDHTGRIWVGTESGVFIADGARFIKQKAFDDAHVELTRAMHEDRSGRIWVLDSRHLVYWKDGVLRPIDQFSAKILSAEGVDLVSVSGDPDAIYVLQDGKLRRISSTDGGRTWQVTPALSPALLQQYKELRALSTVLSVNSALWAGCGQSICRLDLAQQRVQVFGNGEGVAPDTWKRFLLTRDGSLWARGGKRILCLPHGASRFSAPVAVPKNLDLNVQEASLLEDTAGNIVLNLAKGIASLSGRNWHTIDEHSGLPEDELQTLFLDRTGDLWLAPLGHGVMRWHGYGEWEGWTTSEGLGSNVVWSSARDHAERLWVVTHAGLDSLDPRQNKVVSQSASLPFKRLYTVAVDSRQHVWTGDASGQVIDFNPQNGKARIATSQLGRIFLIKIDKQEHIWVCSRAGLSFFSSADGWTTPHLAANGFPDGYAWALTEGADNTIWATTGRGLFRLQNNRWEHIDLPFPGGTSYNFMIAAAPDGTLWAQSKKPSPMLHLKVAANAAHVIGSVDTAMLGSDNITFVDTDSRGWVWVGSDNGVQVYNGTRWVQCTQDDGLLWDDTDFHGFYADPDGSIWIATSAGLSHLIHPEHLFTQEAPKVQFAEVRLANLDISGQPNRSFDLREPALSVRLLNTNYNRRNAIVYRFRLDGLEREWQDTDGALIRYPALNPGAYSLSVVAYDQRLHLTSSPLTLSFTVLEPWWRRTWFRSIEGLAAMLLLYGTWRVSVHLLVLRQQELEALVASRTLELEREKCELLNTRSALLETTRRDSLTGLLNRAAIFAEMKSMCATAFGTGTPLAIAMADLDSFKSINDTYGHVFGDLVLRECAGRIGHAVRPTDWVGRYGGEELLILLPGLTRSDAAHRLEELRLAIAGTPICDGRASVTVTCSFGVAWLDPTPKEIEVLVTRADQALYLAKQNGRNRVEFAYEGDEGVLAKNHHLVTHADRESRSRASFSALTSKISVETHRDLDATPA
ncbi:diguanylate cyclase (GGDEF)-like protein [Granulicella aggregans]|uniref:diguanylate cyclase n=1 Tax=Granulicella aggregans TaxID=474949 RepID=A0A7W7ZK58_9BACT|nr:ligand-binding sensor domain-containing diguanylate cyclase [Granulicella aggregans]MBB5061228.1 diguanylate cyclase (GGDEF)-like protein [Granulicella aggregans]